MTPAFEWQFGGWLRHWPAPVAWGILGLLAVGAVALVVWLYRRTLRTLPPGASALLTALRVGIALLLLACLANPSRVQKTERDSSTHDSLAILVDHSDSMASPDSRGATRLANAVRAWKQHEAEAQKAFPRTVFRSFATNVSTANNLEDAAQSKVAGTETHLYDALHETLAASPGAVVCFTDGLDTTSGNSESLAADAQRRGVPLYFVLGSNRTRGGTDMVNIRGIKAPSRVLRQTEFTASALLEITSRRNQEIPVELWSGESRLASAHLALHKGLNTLPWAVQTLAKEAGPMPLEFRVGAGDKQQAAACTTQVIANEKVEVLYYQGALQWGYRYLLAALESDPSFHVTGILNPALGVQITAGSQGHSILPDLPDDVRALKPYQIIVLAHVFADRLSERQQRAVMEYARGGGGVLFIAPDTEATQRFSGTELEKMLPVVFAPPGAGRDQDSLTGRMREQLAEANSSGDDDALFGATSRRQSLPTLQPFALPPGVKPSRTAAIFQKASPADLPKFCDYAKVRAVKPGADILAVQAAGVSAAGSPPRVLLARQAFGAGFTATLATDLLWRWKMSLPSTSRAAETFWQQLLLSLTPPPGAGLRLVKLTDQPAVNTKAGFRVEGPVGTEAAPVVQAIAPGGQVIALPLRAVTTGAGGSLKWETELALTTAGRWEVRAADAAQNHARLTFPVSEKRLNTENLDLPPDVDGLRRLAQSTGGALIEDEPVFQDRIATAQEEAPSARVQPLWNSGWLLALMLALYGTELIVRRWQRLL